MPGDIDPRALTIAFGKRMRELREREGLSQDALSDRAKLTDRSLAASSAATRPRWDAHRVAQGLVTPGELLDELVD